MLERSGVHMSGKKALVLGSGGASGAVRAVLEDKGADSIKLLERVGGLVKESGWKIVDIDSVLMIQEPKMSPHREQMRKNIAAALDIPVDNIGVKATTTEWLGYEGRGEGVSAQAVALLER